MAPNDLPDRSTVGDPARIAKDIIESLVRDLKLQPGEFVYERPLCTAFGLRGLTVEHILGGLEHARQQGWLISDPVQRIYTLTSVGFEIG